VSLPVHCARSVFKIAAQTTLMKTSTVKTTQQMRQQQSACEKLFTVAVSCGCVSVSERVGHTERKADQVVEFIILNEDSTFGNIAVLIPNRYLFTEI